MKATQLLHDLGQSIWLDNITRDLLDSGTLKRFVDGFFVTGLTSNPTIFDHAIRNSTAYDGSIRDGLARRQSGDGLFFELALDDVTRVADLFRPICDRMNGTDGWASLEVSPILAHDTASTVREAEELCARAGRPNLFIKIPGTKEGLPAIEDVVARLIAALEPDDVVLGGGNVTKLEAMPPHCHAGDNANAFQGGFRLWERGLNNGIDRKTRNSRAER